MSAAVQQMFDRIAPTYDAVNRILSVGIDQRWRRRAVASLDLGRLGGEALAIDLCAGTLDLTRMLLLQGAHVQVQAVDFSAQMLRRGLAKVPERDRERVSVLTADITALPLPDARADAVVCGFGIRNVDRERLDLALKEARRVLRPGGRLAVLDFFRPQRRLTRAAHVVYNRHVLPTLGGLFSGDREAYRYLVSSIEGFLSSGEFALRLEQAGFCCIHRQDLTLGIATLISAEAPTPPETPR